MTTDELRDEINGIFNPDLEPDEFPHLLYAPKALRDRHPGMDFTYLDSFDWEGSTMHQHTRISPREEKRLPLISRNLCVSELLFQAGLKTFADSIVAYNDRDEREGAIRYYPPTVLTFWSGFETFVRDTSERFVIVCKDVPTEVNHYLLEEETFVDGRSGKITSRVKYQSVLNRYSVLLKYGYGFDVDRGAPYWQNLEKSQELRDYYTHLDVTEARQVSSEDVVQFMEAVLIAIITPSVHLRRTLLLSVYHLYSLWSEVAKLASPFIEAPPLMKMHMERGFMFHCNFDNVDADRFPNSEEMRKRPVGG